MRRTMLMTMLVLSLATSGALMAQNLEITPFVGYRLGGGLDAPDIQESFDFSDSESYGVAVDIPLGVDDYIEIFYSTQATRLEDSSGFLDGEPLFDIDIDYWHIGGLHQWNNGDIDTFLVATVGVTEFNPGPQEINSESRFSLGLGGGAKVMFGERVGLRFEGRGFTTFIDTNSEVFCDPFRCYSFASATVLWQFEARIGLVLAF